MRLTKKVQHFAYFASVKDLKIDKCLDLLSKERKDKALAYKFEEDQKLSVGVYLLLRKALKIHHLNIDDYKYFCNEKGKPFLEDCPFQFSLSHSGDIVAVALSTKPVGVDVEYMKDINFESFKSTFNSDDLNYFDMSKNKKDAFYKIWTNKESYLKKTGEGLSVPLNEIQINHELGFNGDYFVNISQIKDYKLTVCTEKTPCKHIKELKL